MQRLSTFCGDFQRLYITARTLVGTVVEFDTSSVWLSRKLFRVYNPVTGLEYRVKKVVPVQQTTSGIGHRVIRVVFFGLASDALNVRNNYILFCFYCFFWCPCMAINASVEYNNGGLLPDIILSTQCYFHRGTRLYAMKRFCIICSL